MIDRIVIRSNFRAAEYTYIMRIYYTYSFRHRRRICVSRMVYNVIMVTNYIIYYYARRRGRKIRCNANTITARVTNIILYACIRNTRTDE